VADRLGHIPHRASRRRTGRVRFFRSFEVVTAHTGVLGQAKASITCIGDEFDASAGIQSFAFSHINRHGTPFILIVDHNGRVVQADRRAGWRKLVETIGPVSGERLPEPLSRLVLRHLRSDHFRELATVAVLEEDVVVSVASFEGTEELFACSIWQLRRESVLEDARRRFLLTNRECEMLDRILSGDASATIAQTLRISLATVEWHTKRLLHKTDSLNRTQLAVRVLGWLPDAS
jgi:DNA-binding CsgD family transcriptional regulator